MSDGKIWTQRDQVIADSDDNHALREFADGLSAIHDIGLLESLLYPVSPTLNRPVFRRLEELVPDKVDLWLAEAFWDWSLGRDEEAFAAYDRAKAADPYDYRVMAMGIRLSWSDGPDVVLDLLRELLRHHPGTDWAVRLMADLVAKGGRLTGHDLPDFDLDVTGRRRFRGSS